MDTPLNEQPGLQEEGESLNTGSSGKIDPASTAGNEIENTAGQQEHSHHKGGIHNNALYAASMGRSATAQVDPHSNSGLAQTGTNISYDGATAPGAGGSVGTGFASGKEAADETISTSSDYDEAGVGRTHKEEDQQSEEDTEDESEEGVL